MSHSGAFNFGCDEGDYGCTTLGSSGQTWVGTRTGLMQLTARPDTFTVGGGNYLYAWGIKLLSVRSAYLPCYMVLDRDSCH